MTKLVGILNLSPDSFSDGRNYTKDQTTHRIEELIDDGSDIIDIGAESTAPGSTPITAEEELSRLKDVFELLKNYTIPFSLDTTKASIAKIGIEQGITIINDVSWGRADDDMMSIIAQYPHIHYIMMYAKNSTGRADTSPIIYPEGIIQHLIEYFEERIQTAQDHGISPSQIILDPGMWAFISHDTQDSLTILRNIQKLKDHFHLPLLIGTSRKWFLKTISPDQWPADRVWWSIASSLYALDHWADYLRIHDIRWMKQAKDTWNILNNT